MNPASLPKSPPPEPKDVHVLPGPTDGSAFTGAAMGQGNITEIHDTNPLDVTLPYHMQPRVEKATHDAQLQQFVNSATLSKDRARKRICLEAFGDNYNRMRELGGRIKQHTLDHLDYYLEQFVTNAAAAGAKVHFAETTDEANGICLDIARKCGAKLCVKSKSMVTEEMHLLPKLESIGVETVETDLGEFILQLDKDAPSHIVQPMIHKDRAATARAFTRELHVEYTEDPGKLCQIARNLLRNKYRQADMGICGGNFLIADTGTVVICTNEGNGRLCTSAPRVLVAFVGIEKLVPSLEHLGVLLKLLARSATGQPLTVYNHFMTGPRRPDEHDGPEEMHIILVDNGRVKTLKEETREMLRCIRCGACLNTCPVYRKIGGHAYGSVYSGPIGAILTPMLKGLGNYPDLPHASSLCGACYEACPVKINIPKFLIQLRRDQIKQKITRWPDRLIYRVWAATLRNSLTYRLGGWMQKWMFRLQARGNGSLGRAGSDPYASRGWLSDAPGPVKSWTRERDMPTPPARSFRQWWDEHEKDKKSKEA
ncbi:MAG: iron-sulfur cluster-binding protein [Phycisphaeraceae bacterium]|nr:iron-sulfur cluster-binding protein [Phycisphaeraceae bacterium]